VANLHSSSDFSIVSSTSINSSSKGEGNPPFGVMVNEDLYVFSIDNSYDIKTLYILRVALSVVRFEYAFSVSQLLSKNNYMYGFYGM
jgi:hypothetical protein